jgi:NADPH2:quinone reductase
MSQAVFVRAHGGPEVLRLEERTVPDPGPGEVRVRNRAIGLNFLDTYQRSGLYPTEPPFVAGNEGAGEVTAVGPDVDDVAVGDRVCYFGPMGAYAEERIMPAGRLAKVPDGVDFETAAAVTLKGLTAYYLLFETFALGPRHTVLVHAAAGGTGTLLTRWASAVGARVIGTAGSAEKAELARQAGADAAIDYSAEDFVARTRELTGGEGVDVVYDGVGAATFDGSLDVLRPRGLMVSFGNASGPVSLPSLLVLAQKGSLYLTRPTIATYMATTRQLREGAKALFGAVLEGTLHVRIDQRYALSDAADAHHDLEARNTTGASVLVP